MYPRSSFRYNSLVNSRGQQPRSYLHPASRDFSRRNFTLPSLKLTRYTRAWNNAPFTSAWSQTFTPVSSNLFSSFSLSLFGSFSHPSKRKLDLLLARRARSRFPEIRKILHHWSRIGADFNSPDSGIIHERAGVSLYLARGQRIPTSYFFFFLSWIIPRVTKLIQLSSSRGTGSFGGPARLVCPGL